MASNEMETLKAGMKMMMAQGFAPKFDGSMDPLHLRAIVQAAQERMSTEPGVAFIPKTYARIEAEISMPESARDDYLIVYIHGGGLICGNAFSSRGYASVLAAETKHPVVSFSYRLAPENPFPAAVDDCFAVYRALLEEYPDTPIFLTGESGGAYLSLVTAMKCRDEGVKKPAAMALHSPVIEFSGKLDRHFEDNEDFTINPDTIGSMGEMYMAPEAGGDRYAEPWYDELSCLPPTFLSWDENESLSVDAQIVAERLRKAGTEVKTLSYPHCFHAFATTGRGTPESYEVMKQSIAFFNSQSSSTEI